MVTKYDVFEIIYKNKIFRPIDIVNKLGRSEKDYKNIHRILVELEENKLLIKTEGGFEINKNNKSKSLYEIIYFCLSNDINYNLLLDKNLIQFVFNGLRRGEINQKNTNINPRTFTKYFKILDKYGLFLWISKKPLRARIFYNTLINNLLVYFDFGHLNLKKISEDYISEVEKGLSVYKRLRKKNEIGFQKIVNEFEVYFVHHSLSLEGNPITLPDTVKILRDKIIPANLKTQDVDALKNYQNAILIMLRDAQSGKQLTIEGILNYHKIAMAHEPEIAGKIREVEVHIKKNPNFMVSKAENVRKDLEALFIKYNNFVKKKTSIKEIINFASYFHNEFQHIHPFVDGNSRTTRLITFHLLHLKGIPILDIPFGLLDDYMNQTKGSKNRDDKNFAQSLGRIILFNIKKINEKLSI